MSRYDLTDFEWRVIEPLLPNKPRGVPRVDDRRVLNGIFWVLRSGAPWRDLPEHYGPRSPSMELVADVLSVFLDDVVPKQANVAKAADGKRSRSWPRMWSSGKAYRSKRYGVDKWEAAGFLGMSTNVLERTYGKHHPDFMREAADAITRTKRKSLP